MRKLLTIILVVSVRLLSAQIVGFNHGQIHHELQKRFADNGNAPQSWVDSMKALTPKGMLDVCRMSGTMSNNWALDLPGFNYNIHNNQINGNRNWKQPDSSYIYAFINLYKQTGAKQLVWTLNTHQAYIARKEGRIQDAVLWEKRMWEAFHYVRGHADIIAVCMDNEWWMDFRLCGVSSGSLNAGDKFRYAGFGGLFRPNNFFEPQIRADMRAFMDYLQPIADSVRKVLPKAKILATVDNTTHLRGRLLFDVVKQYKFYDALTPHIYIQAGSSADVNRQVSARLAQYRGYKLWVTEFNYDFGTNDSNTRWGDYVLTRFRWDMISAIRANPDVEAMFFHTWWMGISSYGWLKD